MSFSLFHTSPRTRMMLLGGLMLLALLGHLVIDALSAQTESQRLRRLLTQICQRARLVPLDHPGEVYPGLYVLNPRVIRVDKRGKIAALFLLEAEVHCGGLRLMAVTPAGRIMNWQWDFRYLETREPGRNWLLTTVVDTMGRGDHYYLLLDYPRKCVQVRSLYYLPLRSQRDWDGLLYHAVIFSRQGRLQITNPTGYKVMPISLGRRRYVPWTFLPDGE